MKTAFHVNNEDYFTIPDSLTSQEITNLKRLSKKNTFQCPFCKAFLDSPAGPERYPYFRHRHSESCDGAIEFEKRSATYVKQTQRENTRHPVVISFLKDELKQLENLYPTLKLVEGRFDSSFQKYIPDLVVYLNKSAYTISVITQINDVADEALAKNLNKRKQYYEDKGYVSLWFVERGHAATDVTGQEIVLWQSEMALLAKSKEDIQWSTFIQSFTSADVLTKVLRLNKSLDSLDVRSIYYLSAKDNAKFNLYRTILEKYTYPKRALIIGTPYELTIQEIFKVKDDSFLLEIPKIDEAARVLFKAQYDQEHLSYLQEPVVLEDDKQNKTPQTKLNQSFKFNLESNTSYDVLVDSKKIQAEKAAAIENYKLYLRSFTIEAERANIPPSYLSLFDLFVEKYQLTTVNFPGICKTKIYGYQKVPFPVSLWQLWVVDKIFTTYQNEPLTVYSLTNRFGHQFNIHRVNLGPIREVFNQYLLTLEQAGILGHKKSEFYKEPYPINIQTPPLINSLKENSYIAFYFSNYYYADDPFGEEAKEAALKYKHLTSNYFI